MVAVENLYQSSDTTEILNHRNEIDKLVEKPLKAGDIWYMIDVHWFRQWQKFTGMDEDKRETVAGLANMNPGPIDNSGLLDCDPISGEYSLKLDLLDELNYVLVPEEAWLKLKNAFTVTPNQPELARHVIESGMFIKQNKVEIYPFEFSVYLCKNETVKDKIVIGRSKTIEQLASEIRRKFSLTDNQKMRFIVKHKDGNEELLKLGDSVLLQDSGFFSGQTVMIDCQNADGSWNFVEKKSDSNDLSTVFDPNRASVHKRLVNNAPTAPSFGTHSTISSSMSEPSFSSFHGNRKAEAPGLCGLSNLGNTCFMNSALQCMSNTPPLTNYLLNGKYVEEINESNPLGMRGEMARAYADLIKQIWGSKFGVVIPRQFKTTVGRFAPQFSGYQQQDSQELLAFLLDGLHEDLNRVRRKPYIEQKDNYGKPDAEVAAEAWSNYKLRNDSIVVDLFHALLKSTLVCPQCEKVSVTFDPFCYLSLPLPMKKDRSFFVTFVPLDTEGQSTKYRVTAPKNGSIKDLAEGLSQLVGLPTDRFVFAEVYANRFYKTFSPSDNLSPIMDRDDIYAYEIDQFSQEDHPVSLFIYNRLYKTPVYAGYNHNSLIGLPLIVVIRKDQINYNGLYSVAKKAVSRFVNFPPDDEAFSPSSENENDSGVDEDSNNADDNNSRAGASRLVSSQNTGDTSGLFKMVITNANGTSELNQVGPGNEIPYPDNNDIYLCLEWNPAAEKFINNKPEYVNHESVAGLKTPKKNIVLSECLDLFTTTEKLGQDDLWFCPHCKVHQQATKKFDLWSLPEILIIHLKRFSYTRSYRDKIEGLVEFPLEGLDISRWIVNEKEKNTGILYDLIAVSNHFGGLGGGHYTAYAKNKFTNRWYVFDDSSVGIVDESEVITKAAYVLVYARRHAEPVNHESDPNVEMEDVE